MGHRDDPRRAEGTQPGTRAARVQGRRRADQTGRPSPATPSSSSYKDRSAARSGARPTGGKSGLPRAAPSFARLSAPAAPQRPGIAPACQGGPGAPPGKAVPRGTRPRVPPRAPGPAPPECHQGPLAPRGFKRSIRATQAPISRTYTTGPAWTRPCSSETAC